MLKLTRTGTEFLTTGEDGEPCGNGCYPYWPGSPLTRHRLTVRLLKPRRLSRQRMPPRHRKRLQSRSQSLPSLLAALSVAAEATSRTATGTGRLAHARHRASAKTRPARRSRLLHLLGLRAGGDGE